MAEPPAGGPTGTSGASVEARQLVRDFAGGGGVNHVLRGLDLSAAPGAVIAITGRSGAGKTTTLNLLGGLDRPTAGEVLIDGVGLGTLDAADLRELRRVAVAYVYQAPSLIPILSAAENVEVSLRLRRVPSSERDARVVAVLDEVGLGRRSTHRPDELSGGEQQRVAVARALVGGPRLLLADEPTAQLDHETSRSIAGLLRRRADGDGMTIVLASNDPVLLAIADVVLHLVEGRLESVDGPVRRRGHTAGPSRPTPG
jgi:putative ABC transport system ATP-binding protein